jgi:hypothetical protein
MGIKHYIVTGALMCLALIPSCKKGCTHASAYNYVSSAKVDDGNCLYCDSTMTSGGSTNTSVQDNNSSSPFAGNTVANLTATSNFVQYSGNGCALRGHPQSNQFSDTVSTYYTGFLQNETPYTMVFSGSIEIFLFTNSGNVELNYSVQNISVPPNGGTTFNIGSGGQQVEFTSFNVSVPSASFSYH